LRAAGCAEKMAGFRERWTICRALLSLCCKRRKSAIAVCLRHRCR